MEALQAAAGKVLLLAYFDKFEGADHAAYEAAAQKDDNVHFLKTTAAEVAKKWGIKKALGELLERNVDEGTSFVVRKLLGGNKLVFSGHIDGRGDAHFIETTVAEVAKKWGIQKVLGEGLEEGDFNIRVRIHAGCVELCV